MPTALRQLKNCARIPKSPLALGLEVGEDAGAAAATREGAGYKCRAGGGASVGERGGEIADCKTMLYNAP